MLSLEFGQFWSGGTSARRRAVASHGHTPGRLKTAAPWGPLTTERWRNWPKSSWRLANFASSRVGGISGKRGHFCPLSAKAALMGGCFILQALMALRATGRAFMNELLLTAVRSRKEAGSLFYDGRLRAHFSKRAAANIEEASSFFPEANGCKQELVPKQNIRERPTHRSLETSEIGQTVAAKQCLEFSHFRPRADLPLPPADTRRHPQTPPPCELKIRSSVRDESRDSSRAHPSIARN